MVTTEDYGQVITLPSYTYYLKFNVALIVPENPMPFDTQSKYAINIIAVLISITAKHHNIIHFIKVVLITARLITVQLTIGLLQS